MLSLCPSTPSFIINSFLAYYRSLFLLMHSGCLRADDAQLLNICDIAAPITLDVVKPSICKLYTMVLKGGKNAEGGKPQYIGVTRHADVYCCSIGALGRYLVKRFTIDKEPFPDPHKDWDDW
jgi:hypothetical protein